MYSTGVEGTRVRATGVEGTGVEVLGWGYWCGVTGVGVLWRY